MHRCPARSVNINLSGVAVFLTDAIQLFESRILNFRKFKYYDCFGIGSLSVLTFAASQRTLFCNPDPQWSHLPWPAVGRRGWGWGSWQVRRGPTALDWPADRCRLPGDWRSQAPVRSAVTHPSARRPAERSLQVRERDWVLFMIILPEALLINVLLSWLILKQKKRHFFYNAL